MRPTHLTSFLVFALLFPVQDAAAQTKYYEDLKVLCREKSSVDCCLASVAAMEAGGFRLSSKKEKENYGCPEGFDRNMMRCIDSLQWCQPVSSGEKSAEEIRPEPEHIKVYLQDRIHREREAMDESSENYQALQKAWRPLLKEEDKKLERLQRLVEQTPQDQLPKVLVNLFLEEDITERGQFPEVDPYLIMMGESIVPLLIGSYDLVASDIKEKILRILTAVNSPHAITTVRKALSSSRVREVMAGQAALRQLLGDKAVPELLAVMENSDNKEIIKSSLRQIEFLEQVDWCGHFFEAWRAGKVGFADLFDVGDPQECTSRSLGEHVDLLLAVLNSDGGTAGEQFWIRDLISKIDQPGAVYDLLPLWPQLVMERFRSGGVLEGYENQAQIAAVELGFTDAQADTLLERMAAILDVDELHQMLADSPPLLQVLYIEDLLAKKKGKRLDLGGQIFSFGIEALDGAGEVLASGAYRIKIGEEQNIVLTSSASGFPDHQIALKVLFDPDRMMFHFEPVVIHLLPHAAQFSLDVPVEGVYKTDLLVPLRGERVPVTWRFMHVK